MDRGSEHLHPRGDCSSIEVTVVCVLAGYARVTLMDPIRTPHEDRSTSANMPNPGVVPEKLISDVLLYWPGDEAAMRELRRRVYVNTMMIAPPAH